MSYSPSHKRFRSGFALMEILLAFAILVILAALLFPVMSEARKRSQTVKCVLNIRTYGTALLTYVADRGTLKYWDHSDAETKRETAPQFNKWLVEGKYLSSSSPLRCPLADGSQYDNVPGRYRFPYAGNKTLCATYPRLSNFPVPAHRVALVAEVNDWDGYESYTSLNSAIWRAGSPGEEGSIRDSRMPIARYHGGPERRGLHFFFADGSAQLIFPTDNDWSKAPTYAPTDRVDSTGYFYHRTHYNNMKNGTLRAQ